MGDVDVTDEERAEEALRQSEARFRTLFETMSEGFSLNEIICDDQGKPCDLRYLDVNPAFERHTGLRAVDILGRTTRELFPDAEPEWFERYGKVALTGEPAHFESPFGPLGKWFEVSAYRTEPGRFAVVFFDITDRKRAEEALRQSEERLRALHERLRIHVETTPLALVEWDAEYRVAAFSPRAEQMFGWRAEEVVGRRIDEIPWIPEEDWPSVGAVMRDMSSGARPTNVNANRNFRKDGSTIYCEWYNSTVRGDGGQLVSVLSLVLDVTERKRAEEALRESEQMLRALADSMPQLAWTAQPDGYITWYNRRWYEYTGTTPEQMEGWGWQVVHDPATLPDVLRRWKRSIATGTAFDMEFPLRGANGKFRRFLTRVFPLADQDGKVLRWFGTNTDVTELVEAQDALREAARHKDEFLGMLSHELRNPLSPIRNSVYILEHVDPTAEQAKRARSVITRQTEHLTRLVDDLLDVTRIARGKIELRRSRLDLREVVLRAGDDFRLMLEDRGVAFRTALPEAKVWADADATRITQIVGNLLHNAAKFTRRGDEVTLSLQAVEDCAQIRVRDTGAGLDATLLPTVFEPFVQGERTLARTEGGLGLGLALVRGIAELHDGSVRAESAGKGRGADFIVRLPLLEPAVPEDAPCAGTERSRGHRRVLVVDDNVDAAESLSDIVRMLGHSTEVAYDGPSAIEKARANPPDVVLCDIGLPGMSGYEVAKTLRANGLRGVQLVAVSGYAQPEDVKAAVEAGFDRHIAKPASPEEIERILAS